MSENNIPYIINGAKTLLNFDISKEKLLNPTSSFVLSFYECFITDFYKKLGRITRSEYKLGFEGRAEDDIDNIIILLAHIKQIFKNNDNNLINLTDLLQPKKFRTGYHFQYALCMLSTLNTSLHPLANVVGQVLDEQEKYKEIMNRNKELEKEIPQREMAIGKLLEKLDEVKAEAEEKEKACKAVEEIASKVEAEQKISEEEFKNTIKKNKCLKDSILSLEEQKANLISQIVDEEYHESLITRTNALEEQIKTCDEEFQKLFENYEKNEQTIKKYNETMKSVDDLEKHIIVITAFMAEVESQQAEENAVQLAINEKMSELSQLKERCHNLRKQKQLLEETKCDENYMNTWQDLMQNIETKIAIEKQKSKENYEIIQTLKIQISKCKAEREEYTKCLEQCKNHNHLKEVVEMEEQIAHLIDQLKKKM